VKGIIPRVKLLEEEFRSQNPEFRRKTEARRNSGGSIPEKKGQRSGRLKNSAPL
jgi:hypothetical protein